MQKSGQVFAPDQPERFQWPWGMHERFENVLQPHFGGIRTFAVASPDAVIIVGGGTFFSLLCTRNKQLDWVVETWSFINHTLGVTRD